MTTAEAIGAALQEECMHRTCNDDSTTDRSEGDINISPIRHQWQQTHLDAHAWDRVNRDSHAFIHQCLSTPCLNALQSCEGIYLEDVQGRKIMDFHGNYVHQVGFRHPDVIRAIKAQLDSLPFCTRRYTNDPAIELANRLITCTPDALSKVLFAPSGAVAIGIALQLAKLNTGRFKTVSMWDAFHGATAEAASVGGESLFRSGMGPLLPGTVHVPPSGVSECVFGCEGQCQLRCADYLEYVLDHEQDVAAVVAEPIRASTVTIPHTDFWKRVRSACDKHGTLLIFDEIPTGLGRTGRMCAFEHFEVCPDILVLGKGLGGGVMPMAAVVARGELDVVSHKALGHYTHEKSPVGAAAGVATLDCLMRDNLVQHAEALGDQLQQKLRSLKSRHAHMGVVRGKGLLVGVDVMDPKNPTRKSNELAERVMYEALSRGLSFKVGGGNSIVLAPPLIINEQQIDAAVDVLDSSFAAVV